MNPIGSNSVASQVYGGVQRNNGESQRTASRSSSERVEKDSGFKLPSSATPRGDWVLGEANPQSFEPNSPRGTYLNVVV